MLYSRSVRLHSIFDHLETAIDMSSFENRLVFQKKVYFLQEFGIGLGYAFGWYLRGPYSSEAAAEGFELAVSEMDRCEISPADREILQSFEHFIEDIESSFERRTQSYVLELLASLHFILKHGYPRRNVEEAARYLVEKKSKFSNDVELARGFLEEHSLV